MRLHRVIVSAVVLLLTGFLVASAEDSKAGSSGSDSPAINVWFSHKDIKEKTFTATVGADGVQHVNVIGGGYFFDPNHIIVKANVPVELSVKKESGYVPHDIVVKAPEAGIDFEVSLKDAPQIIKFTPTKPGMYEMYCSKKLPFVKSHKDRGMDGMIEVVP